VTGQGIIQASPERVLAEVSNEANWKSWDSLLNGYEIKKYPPRFRVRRRLPSLPLLFAAAAPLTRCVV
jgi:hypothetical protein